MDQLGRSHRRAPRPPEHATPDADHPRTTSQRPEAVPRALEPLRPLKRNPPGASPAHAAQRPSRLTLTTSPAAAIANPSLPRASHGHEPREKPNASGVKHSRTHGEAQPEHSSGASPHGFRRGPTWPISKSLALSPMPSHTSRHAPVTNTIDAAGPPNPNPREQHRIGPRGRQKTVLPTCARWSRARAR